MALPRTKTKQCLPVCMRSKIIELRVLTPVHPCSCPSIRSPVHWIAYTAPTFLLRFAYIAPTGKYKQMLQRTFTTAEKHTKRCKKKKQKQVTLAQKESLYTSTHKIHSSCMRTRVCVCVWEYIGWQLGIHTYAQCRECTYVHICIKTAIFKICPRTTAIPATNASQKQQLIHTHTLLLLLSIIKSNFTRSTLARSLTMQGNRQLTSQPTSQPTENVFPFVTYVVTTKTPPKKNKNKVKQNDVRRDVNFAAHYIFHVKEFSA